MLCEISPSYTFSVGENRVYSVGVGQEMKSCILLLRCMARDSWIVDHSGQWS